MIIGLGTDLLDIRRIERTLERFGDRFVSRIYTDSERAKAEQRHHVPAAYAMRYAAKEACSKALGTGFREGVFWRDLVTDSLPSGKPVMTLSGGALEKLRSLTPPGMTARIEVTMSDEYPMAHAVVIIYSVPASQPATSG
ncbi:MAG: holo-ACP synthase [Rhodospirillales bacterium]